MRYKCKLCGWEWQSNNYPVYCQDCNTHAWDVGDNVKCCCCKKTLMIPYIHHLDGNHKNNSLNNRIPICNYCHLAVHNNNFSPKSKYRRKTSVRRENGLIKNQSVNSCLGRINELKIKLIPSNKRE